MTDRDRILEALRHAGPSGLHSLDMRRQGLSANPSQRVIELRQRGYTITAKVERQGKRHGTRYTLVSGIGSGGGPSLRGARGGLPPPVPAAASGAGTQEEGSGSLFELEPPKPRNPLVDGDLDEAA